MAGGDEQEEEVLIKHDGNKRSFILNRQKQLNALTLNMIRTIQPTLMEWAKDPAVALVLVKGRGEKAFCAGGDVIAVIKAKKNGHSLYKDFFREEYRLNYLIGTLDKPYIALMDGITMGGGCGLSVHGKFRVVTERTVLAMPETALGLFPDVGGSYFLPRLPGSIGTFLALTGHRLKGVDVFHAGIATHFVSTAKVAEMETALLALADVSDGAIDRLLLDFQRQSGPLPSFSLDPHIDRINAIFDSSSVEETIARLNDDGSDWALQQRAVLERMSPTSLKVTFRQLQNGARLSFKDAFTMEYRLTQRFLEDKDFFEGCRAILIDKDNKPRWDPPTLAEVSEEKLNHYFSPLPDHQDLVMRTTADVELPSNI